MRTSRPIRPDQPRTVGRAFTLRFIPVREDLATAAFWTSPRSARSAVEEIPRGSIAVVGAMGVIHAGIFGDIFCARMKARGVAALVTDGVLRDLAGVVETGLPVWCQGGAAPPSTTGLTFVNWQEPIGCGGVAVIPGDVVVADNDGAVVIPAAFVDEVVALAAEQERLESWIMEQVEQGGSYPASIHLTATIARAMRPPDARVIRDVIFGNLGRRLASGLHRCVLRSGAARRLR